MYSMIMTLLGVTLAAHTPPADTPPWTYAVYAFPAVIPVNCKYRDVSIFVSILCTIASIIGPLSLILPGPFHGCSDLEYFGILIASSGLSLHCKHINSPFSNTD